MKRGREAGWARIALVFIGLGAIPEAMGQDAGSPAGVWLSNFGKVELEIGPPQSSRVEGKPIAKAKSATKKARPKAEKSEGDREVKGRWTQSPSKVGIIRAGSYDEAKRLLTFTYYQDWNKITGNARFTLSEDGMSLEGNYQQPGEGGAWVLNRLLRLTPAQRLTKVDEVVARAGCGPDTPGVGVMIIHRGKIVLEKCYGLASLKAKRPLAPNTPIELASISKSMTAFAVMRLADQGLISFDDDVRKFLPELPQPEKGRIIHVHDLLHHTSGLPLYTRFAQPKGRLPGFVSNEDYAGEFARQAEKFPVAFAPGQKYEYSNTNYMLLALIVERLAKKPFRLYMEEELFKPLGMKDSWIYQAPGAPPLDAEGRSRSAMGYTRTKQGAFRPNRTMPPDGNEYLLTGGDGYGFASLEDMGRWDAGVRSSGLVRPATWRRALTPSKTGDGMSNPYGFGLNLTFDRRGDLEWIGHKGFNDGVSNDWWRNLLHDRSVIVLTCCPSFDGSKIWAAVDRYCADLE